MFQSPVEMHYRNCTIDTEIVGDDQQPVAALKLVVEPFTPELASELSDQIHDHCFTKDRQIRHEIDSLTFELDEKQQFVTVRMTEDSPEASAILRFVRVPQITIAKRGGESTDRGERAKKKVAPPTAILRATLTALVPPDAREIQEFLCRRIKSTFVFGFEAEEKEFQFGPTPTPDETQDDEAETALDFEEPAPPAPRLVDKAPTRAAVVASLDSQGIELAERHLKKLTAEQRTAIVAWVDACHEVEKAKGRDVTAADLPQAPDYVLNPKLLDGADAPAMDPAAGDVLADAKPATPRAPRRSSKTFTNPPRVAKGSKGKK